VKAKTFNPTATWPARAIQAWVVLVGMAKNRQTIPYGNLGLLMFGRRAPGVLSQILGHIAYWCDDHGLPPLNAIVVGAARGTPGRYIPTPPHQIDSERERVYREDWYVVRPPTENDLLAAWKKRHP
jgi:hypothetical protein